MSDDGSSMAPPGGTAGIGVVRTTRTHSPTRQEAATVAQRYRTGAPSDYDQRARRQVLSMPRDGAQCQLFCRVEAFVALRLRKQIVDSGWHWRLVRQWAFETRDQD